jgi:hypothetical protein
MTAKRSVTSAVVLQVLRWLRRTPESFLAGRNQAPAAGEELPEAGPSQILRFDTAAMHAALDAKRREQGMTRRIRGGDRARDRGAGAGELAETSGFSPKRQPQETIGS